MDHNLKDTNSLQRDDDPGRSRWDDLDLQELLSVLWRRKWLIAAAVFTITGLAALFAVTATPLYTANLQLVFDAKEQSVLNFEAALSGQPQDEAALLSEIEVIQSRALTGRVVDKLGLMSDREFNTELNPPSFFARLLPDMAGRPGEVEAEDKAAGMAGWQERVDQLKRERVIDAVLDRIEVGQSGRSRAVEISFTSDDPVKAAVVANTLGELFLLERLEGRFENARRASHWLAENVQKLREQVTTAETKAEDYRKQHDLLQGERVTLVAEQISTLNAQLSEARRARTDAEANLEQARGLLSSPDKLGTAVQVLESDLIQRLREAQSALARREASLTQELGPMHPQLLQLREERSKLLADVDMEVRKVVISLQNKVDVARRQEGVIVDELTSLKELMGKANEATVGLRTLERDAEANRLMLEKFMTAFMETSAQEDAAAQLPDARIISAAAVPEDASFPNKPLIVAGGFAFSVLAGLLLALSLERLDAGFRSAEQLEAKVGLHVVAHVPLVTGSKGATPADYILERPDSAFGEAIRSLFTRLLLTSPGTPPQVVLITSSEPDEGKTSISMSLARMQARTGRRVVLVDADFRKSAVAEVMGVEAAPGLLEVINGASSLEEAIRHDERSGMDVVVSGAYHSDALHALDVGRIDPVLDKLRALYDLVVIDSAPALVISDAQVLAAKADETMLVVRWGKTRREVVAYAARQLRSTATCLRGAILSQVDVNKHARYNYGDSGYYHGKAKRYYTT